jgi:hypothetical protein
MTNMRSADLAILCSLELRDGHWRILASLLGTDQRIPALGAMHAWGYDPVEGAPLEIEGQRFDSVIRTRQNPPRLYGLVKA